MSISRNSVQSESIVPQLGLSRLLLLCRFDYRQKAWNLPAFALRRDRSSNLLADSAALASTVSKIFRGFHDTESLSRSALKTSTRRLGSRQTYRRTLKKTTRRTKK
jgi:hypothetical protein